MSRVKLLNNKKSRFSYELRSGKKTNRAMQSKSIIPKVYEPTPSDIAFEEFRKIFPVTNNCRVDEEGKYMNYRLPHLRAAFRNLTRAQHIISQQKLPLKVRVHSDYNNHILHIQYAGI